MYNENIKYALFLTRIDVSDHFDMSEAVIKTNRVHYQRDVWSCGCRTFFKIFSIEHRPLPS